MRSELAVRALFVLAIVGGLTACGGGDEVPPQRRSLGSRSQQQGESAPRPGMSPEAAAALDSGNAAYREGDYGAARRHFRAAVRIQPESEAAWFGVYMAERALGNADSARAALERAGDLPHPGGMLHPPPDSGS